MRRTGWLLLLPVAALLGVTACVSHVAMTHFPLMLDCRRFAVGLSYVAPDGSAPQRPTGPGWLRALQSTLARQARDTRQRYASGRSLRLPGDIAIEIRW